MTKTLFYLPLEPYVERYTYLMSKRGGWAEQNFLKHGIHFFRIEGVKLESATIKTGSVVDAFTRSYWAMDQVHQVLSLIEKKKIKDGDVVYTEDFWHPGIESLFYVRDLTGVDFKVGCFMHAQSIDDSDFTHKMKKWIGPIERGLSHGYDYVFVTSPILAGLAMSSSWNANSIKLTGLPYNKSALLDTYGYLLKDVKKKPLSVLFSSRFDSEKNPNFFLDLVETMPDIHWRLVKPRQHLSNDLEVCRRAFDLEMRLENFEIIDTSNKEDYYRALAESEIQFNCAEQDWVSWTLLEAVTFGCKPCYPNHKDFPHELAGFEECIYKHQDLDSAKIAIQRLLGEPYRKDLISIADRHDKSWEKKLEVMGLMQ